ncbi:uncharacterized protein N7506_005919 [Penicillium brevicompactum]|uniref:uncharacterized protein n=1 Tax=Penicillium brevicompactum TaxID=5074 RepID=UPI002541F856|nr:uncharacterized protein N7506_005919 [Penicillium brevicompactum]KAJ5332136.1 hypothetical protein N7506_005919 [Penicillium brevicompactum]
MRVQMYTEEDFQSGDLSSSVLGRVDLRKSKPRFRRNQVACDSCHMRRVQCDLISPSPCSRCLRTGMNCGLSRTLRKRGRTARSKLGNGTATAKHEQCHSPEYLQVQQAHECPIAHSSSTASPMSPTTPASATNLGSTPTNEIDTLLALCTEENHSPFGISQEWEMPGVHYEGDYPKELLEPISQDEGPQLLMPDSCDLGPTGSYSLSHELSPNFSSPADGISTGAGRPMRDSAIWYPVLDRIMITLEPHISCQLACHLLELYFSERSSTYAHAIYGHVPCSLLRRASFLTDDFRPTSPALLASMLWLAAVDDRDCSLPILPSQKVKICQILGNAAFYFLSTSRNGRSGDEDPLAPGSYPPTMAQDPRTRPADLDDVITHIHIASILSDEQRPSSTSRWKTASDMARQLKLNEESYPLPNTTGWGNLHCHACHHEAPSSLDGSKHCIHGGTETHLGCMCEGMDTTDSPAFTEEHLEERRRTWWLLYILDRHLSLRHNRSLEISDAECAALPLPVDEVSWQNGTFTKGFSRPQTHNLNSERQASQDFQFRDCSLFGFFLPLMKISGEISKLNDMQSQGNRGHEIEEERLLQHIGTYQDSLANFMRSANTSDPKSKMLDAFYDTRQQTCVAYASYLVQALRILLLGKRHWLFLIEEAEFWKSPTFISTISHASDGTFWLRRILDLDPDVSFMPYLFGIMLFQASYPMLLVVERLQSKSGKEILDACEVMIRATESCLVTRNTEYQRKFRQLMRSTVSQAWGCPVSASEIQRRRKAVFSLYLWTRRGTHWPVDSENRNPT